MIRQVAALLAFCLVFVLQSLGCNGQTPDQLTAEERASVVIHRTEISDDNSTILYFPACGGTAISVRTILTAGHCATDPVVWVVDADTFLTTSTAKRRATVELLAGDLALLTVATDLRFWANTGKSVDGEASLVRLAGSEFRTDAARLSGFDLVSPPVDHGDSGYGLFQARALVGVVVDCNSSNDKDCDLPGARFEPVP